MQYLRLNRYRDPYTSESKELRIINDLEANWERIGETLGFRPPEINTIRRLGSGRTPEQCLEEVFSKWMENVDKMPSCKRYPCNWKGVYNLLMDSNHSVLASSLNSAVTASRSDLNQTFDQGENYIEDHALSCFYKSLNDCD